MREILFRGKNKGGKWVEGYYANVMSPSGDRIFSTIFPAQTMSDSSVEYSHQWDCVFVIPETVGKFTGLYDKNDKKIFEGDIIQYYSTIDKELTGTPSIVKYGAHSCGCCHDVYGWTTYEVGTGHLSDLLGCYSGLVDSEESTHLNTVEIIGNIHDNPEFLKGEEK